ncbi:hypothetical protein AB0A69_32365 [Streptomyces sp. NPDC045431]|uniref:hypothetical protein n=1 Tax=Streptomyces sp. NPDC045431 TaxID=3155613 RepID=UPI003409C4D9
MDPAVAAVAATAATTLVTAMTTDAWDHTKRGFVRLLGRGQDEEAAAAEAELEQARETVLTAYERGDESALGAAHDDWAARLGAALENADRSAEHERLLRELLAGQPGADGEIRALGAALRGTAAGGVYSQVIQNGGAGAQGPGAAVTINHHHYAAGGAPAQAPLGES